MSAVSFEHHDQVALITIERPKALNALNDEVFRLLDEYVDRCHKQNDIRVAIITGSGEKAFAAGADISEFPELNDQRGEELSLRGQKVFQKIENGSVPFIAAVNGFSLGGGCELAMACHIRLASDNAKFGQPEVNLGLIPGYGGTQRLVQLIGKGRALHLLLTADMIDAATALEYGLVSQVTTPDQLMESAQKLAKKLLSKGPHSLALTIEAVQRQYTHHDGFMYESSLFGQAMGSAESKEGVAAFLEKRKPNW